MQRILLLAGTFEARALAKRLRGVGADVVVSLAGRTSARYPAPTRTGGFGGVEGLARHIRTENVAVVVDATHPFAANISRNARGAAAQCGVRYLRLERPPWRPLPGERWREVSDLGAASKRIGDDERVFLAVGAGGVGPFLGRSFPGMGAKFVLRTIEPPTEKLPPRIALVRQRGPFSIAAERAFWQRHRFTTLVTKNAGGQGAYAKLIIARDMKARVLMVTRPAGQPPADAHTVEEMMDCLAPHL